MNAHSLFAALNHPPLDINFSQVPLFLFLFKLIVHYTTIRSRVYPLLETFYGHSMPIFPLNGSIHWIKKQNTALCWCHKTKYPIVYVYIIRSSWTGFGRSDCSMSNCIYICTTNRRSLKRVTKKMMWRHMHIQSTKMHSP